MFGSGKYQNKEKPLKRQRKLGLYPYVRVCLVTIIYLLERISTVTHTHVYLATSTYLLVSISTVYPYTCTHSNKIPTCIYLKAYEQCAPSLLVRISTVSHYRSRTATVTHLLVSMSTVTHTHVCLAKQINPINSYT